MHKLVSEFKFRLKGGRKLSFYSLAFKKLSYRHAFGTFYIQAEKIFVACKDNVHIRHNGGVQDRLVFCVAYQLFRMIHRRNQLIG